MQTIFLVWFPGIAALVASGWFSWYIGEKALEARARRRAIHARDRLIIDSADLLKEICGSSVVLPDDLQRRVDRQVMAVEATTYKELA